MHPRIQTILDFWFGAIDADGFCVADRSALWWGADAATDREIATRFGTLVRQALDDELDAWAHNARGRLALIILLDQFTRNVYRGQAQAFAGDAKAQRLCEQGIALGHDRALSWVERGFFYMPLEHAENLAAQEHCVQLHRRMLAEAPAAGRNKLQGGLDFALQHLEIIQRFGRFPHRNQALGRASTPEEKAYLDNGGARFGQ